MNLVWKSALVLSLGILGTTVVGFAQMSGTTYGQAKTSGSGVLSFTYMETPGFAARNPQTGQVEGLCIDILDDFVAYVKEQEGISLTYQYKGKDPNDFNAFLSEVQNGRGGVIGLGNITITAARQQQYRFTPAFINNVTLMVTNQSAPNLTDLGSIRSQWNGMKAYAVEGSTNAANLVAIKKQYWPEMEIITLGSSPEVLEAVVKDSRSFTNLDLTYFMAATRAGEPIKRHVMGDMAPEEFGLLMPKGSDWGPVWDRFLTSQYKNSSEFKQKISKHLGATALNLLSRVGG